MPNASPVLAVEALLDAVGDGEAAEAGDAATLGADEATFGVRTVAFCGALGFSSRAALFVSAGAQSDTHAGSTLTACSGS